MGQPWYFNEIYNPNQTQSIGKDIIGAENGYFGCAFSVDSVTDYFYNVCTFTLSPEGILLSWKNFGEYGFDYYTGWHGSLIQTPDSNFANFGSRVSLITTLADGIFYQFDGLGDTMFTRIFTSETYNHFVGRACTHTYDSGFALLAEISINHGYSDVILIKTDSNANEIWRSQQGTTIDDWGHSLIQTTDHGYALGTWAYIPEDRETGDPMVIKTDSLGGFEWSLNLGGPFKDDRAMICHTTDNCIMVLTAYADSMFTSDHAYARINLVKIDLEGNVIWNKKYGPSKPVNYISNIQITQNGGFILCGYSMILDPSFANAGWIMEVNSEGDSLWYKDYYYYPPGSSDPFNELFDISMTEDHGFVAIGQAYNLFGPNQVQKMWVLKVDSVGCEIPNCWVGIEEQGSGEAWGQGSREAGKQGSLEIWPNPVSEGLSVKVLGLSSGIDYTLMIYDLFGREVTALTPTLPQPGEGVLKVDVSSFPAGIYIAVLKSNKGEALTGKFVVQPHR